MLVVRDETARILDGLTLADDVPPDIVAPELATNVPVTLGAQA
jgi:hypothetical protein